MGLVKKIFIGVLVVGVAIGAAFFLGILGTPSAGLDDYGDWGNVTEERTEVITTVWINNPNPIGLQLGNSADVSYQLHLNEVNVAEGEKTSVSIPSGNDTETISTYILNRALPPWWAAFIQNNETIDLRAESTATLEVGLLTTTVDLPTQERTLLQDSTPVITALSEAASAAEGSYTQTTPTGGDVGYEVQRGWATWGEVTRESTTVLFHFRIHNPSRATPLPAVPDGLGMSVDMNNMTMFRAQGEEFSPENIDGDAVIPPGETQEVVLKVEMDNSKIDDWFRSHVKKGEQTQIKTRLQLVFNFQGTTYRVPQQGPAYTCQLQTDIMIDDQNTTTNCGQASSVTGGEAVQNASDDLLTDTPTPIVDRSPTPVIDRTRTPGIEITRTPIIDDTPTPPSVPTSTPESQDPIARASANPTEGRAPLEVTFDASESTDPDGEIETYIWDFDGPYTQKGGEVVTNEFRSEGEYEVTLTVIDNEGNRAFDTVTITVEPRPS